MTHTHKHTDMDMKNNNHVMASGASESNTTDDHTTPISCSSSRVDDNQNKLYKGVRKRKWGKWVSEIRLPNSRERIWLGSHDSPEKAARAFDAALYCLRGRHANFNFPDTPCNMDNNVAVAPHQSLTPQEIQEVAAKFANQTPLLQKPLLEHGAAGNSSSSFGGSTKMLCKSDSIAESTTTSTSTSTSTCTPTTTATASSCSTTMHECDGSMQVEVGHAYGDMDWTFLNVFDYSNEVFPLGSEYDHLYSDELHKIHSGSGELLYSSPPPPPPFQGYEELIEAADDDPFSHQSFLWNWNF